MAKNVFRIIVAIFFSATALLKIFSFPQFVLNVEAFHLLPSVLILPFSIVIVLAELIAGVLLGLNIYPKQFSLLLFSLLGLFTIGIIVNLLQNNVVECGCFGNYFSSELSWWSVLRNIFLGYLLLWISQHENSPIPIRQNKNL